MVTTMHGGGEVAYDVPLALDSQQQPASSLPQPQMKVSGWLIENPLGSSVDGTSVNSAY